ncbi:hypothetical protein C2845_PM11G22870 [Panicum miliaceum]|uniref:Uncharacterized protein n=1 Tax=Panicum miliaceum TaxID=4540 RepID=A0A3L6RWQ0_PANMI|nr:hypothetical protein C2845_PM11G22870 [Panicum miliaceum]
MRTSLPLAAASAVFLLLLLTTMEAEAIRLDAESRAAVSQQQQIANKPGENPAQKDAPVKSSVGESEQKRSIAGQEQAGLVVGLGLFRRSPGGWGSNPSGRPGIPIGGVGSPVAVVGREETAQLWRNVQADHGRGCTWCVPLNPRSARLVLLPVGVQNLASVRDRKDSKVRAYLALALLAYDGEFRESNSRRNARPEPLDFPSPSRSPITPCPMYPAQPGEITALPG